MFNDFGIRLKQAINEKNITASELSRLSGVGKSDISNYINGKYEAKQDKIYRLAKALNVDPGWLMTGVEQEVSDARNISIVVPNSEQFIKIVKHMTTKDYETVMGIFEKTYKHMKEMGVEIE